MVDLSNFQYLLRRASLTENDAFAFLKADNHGDYINYSGFCEALRQVQYNYWRRIGGHD